MGAIFALALGFASCDKNKSNEPENTNGGTFSRITIQQAPLRALTSNQKDVKGTVNEDKVKDGYLFFKTDQAMTITPLNNLTPVADATHAVWQSNAFQTSVVGANKDVAFLLNNRLPLTQANFDPAYTIGLDQLYNVIDLSATGDNGFLMTSATKKITITEGIQKTDVEAGASDDAATNNFSFTVERIVSKAQLREATSLQKNEEIKGSIENLTYAVAGSAKKIYLFKDNAPDESRQLDSTNGEYNGFTSAIDADGLNVYDNVYKLSEDVDNNKPDATTTDKTNFRAKKLLSETTLQSEVEGIYFFENSVKEAVTDKAQLMYNRIAYAKVYATYKPADNEGYKLDADGKLVPALAEDYKGGKYDVKVTDEFHDAHTDLTYGGAAGAWTLNFSDTAGTFFKGSDGHIYTSMQAAYVAGNQTAMKYDGGKMVYMTPLNAQMDDKGTPNYVVNADTRRNNIYDITINGFDAIGRNYDPVDPDDPNIVKPKDNPFEPVVESDVPVDPKTTFMRVTTTILNWNLVSRGVTLK